MSQVPTTSVATSTPSTNFETLFTAALKAYNKQTKKDITSNPLSTELQSCTTSSSIIAILRNQVQDFDQSQGADEKWTKWLDPTVNVLLAFSAALANGVGVVISDVKLLVLEIYHLMCLTAGIPTRECNIHWNWSSTPSEHFS
jgi:hypothetical protein